MTSPLEADGSNFPAKKYATKAKLDALKPVATLVAGQEFSWNLGGTAVHNGGSCQVAIRYAHEFACPRSNDIKLRRPSCGFIVMM